MTENEAIEIIKYASAFNSDNSPLTKALEVAIKASEEIQQYRAIGTVEQVKYLISSYNDMIHDFGDNMTALEEYQEIGTVEECREAVEKMKPKKVQKIQIPNTSWTKAQTRFECPSCHKYLNYRELSHCGLCGQRLLWGE